MAKGSKKVGSMVALGLVAGAGAAFADDGVAVPVYAMGVSLSGAVETTTFFTTEVTSTDASGSTSSAGSPPAGWDLKTTAKN